MIDLRCEGGLLDVEVVYPGDTSTTEVDLAAVEEAGYDAGYSKGFDAGYNQARIDILGE